MAKHKAMCWIVCILVFVGALNWGLTGLGMLMGSNLNVVNLLLGAWPTIEEIVYLLVGIAGLVFGYTVLVSKCCCCMGKCEK